MPGARVATKPKEQAASPAKAQVRSQITAGKLLRLGLKSVAFALIVSTLVSVLGLLNVPLFKTIWFQVGTMLVVYLFAYPYLMREFKPRVKQTKKRH